MVDIAGGNPWPSDTKYYLKEQEPGDPWHDVWPCRDQGAISVGFAGAVQPCSKVPWALRE